MKQEISAEAGSVARTNLTFETSRKCENEEREFTLFCTIFGANNAWEKFAGKIVF